MNDAPAFHVTDVSDKDLWAEVERRGLVTQIGWVNPDIVTEVKGPEFKGPAEGYVLLQRHWLHRWPVFGLRGGTTIASSTDLGGHR